MSSCFFFGGVSEDPKALACAYVQGGHWPVAFELLAMMQDNGEESETKKKNPEAPRFCGVFKGVKWHMFGIFLFFSKNGGLIDVYFIYLPVFHGVYWWSFHISGMKKNDPIINQPVFHGPYQTFYPFPGQITLCWPQCTDLGRVVARFSLIILQVVIPKIPENLDMVLRIRSCMPRRNFAGEPRREEKPHCDWENRQVYFPIPDPIHGTNGMLSRSFNININYSCR